MRYKIRHLELKEQLVERDARVTRSCVDPESRQLLLETAEPRS